MGSKMVLDKQKSSAVVVSAGTEYVDTMAVGMAGIFGGDAEDATRRLVALAVRKLQQDTEAMVRADEAHLNETADDSAVVADRNEQSSEVRGLLIELREGADTVYGPELVRKLGFKGETPKDPTAVETLGTQVLANLDRPSAVAASPVRTGMSMDLGAFKAPVETGLTRLREAITAAAADKRKSDQTLVEKQRAMDQYDLTFSTTANLISHMLRAAGETELAAKVRPSTHKPGQTVADNPDPPSESAAV